MEIVNMRFIVATLLTVAPLLTALSDGGPEEYPAVERGRRTDLRGVLDSAGCPEGCRMRYVDVQGLSCGSVSPSDFSCTHNDSVMYQHFGCFSASEVASFQLYCSEEGRTTVEMLSYEIQVHESRSVPYNVSAVAIDSRRAADHNHFRLVFPAALVGSCQYEVIVGDPLLSLPQSGRLTGLVNQPLPCGFVSSEPLEYEPTGRNDREDFLLLRIWEYTEDEEIVYKVVPLDLGGEPVLMENYTTRDLYVPQLTTTILPDELLPYAGPQSQYKYRFPVHLQGSVCPVYSQCIDLRETVFTSADIGTGLVAFVPTKNYIDPSVTLWYNVTDVVGRVRGGGELVVSIPPRDWNKPSQRTNRGLTVPQGGYAVLDQRSMDFYILPNCLLQSHLKVFRAPRHGNFSYLNGSMVRGQGIPLAGLKNGSIIYTHFGDGSRWDSSVLAIACGSDDTLVVFLALRISPPSNPILPPSAVSSSSFLVTYQHRAIPLTPSLVHLQHLPPSTRLNVAAEVGAVSSVNHPEMLTSTRTALFPYVRASAITANNNSHSFTLSQLSQQAVWYIPPTNGSFPADAITISLPAIPHLSLTVQVIPVGAIGDQLRLSTVGSYPILLQVIPLRLHSFSPMFITSQHLFSTGIGSSAEDITYEVLMPPDFGHLCALTPSECNSSLLQFTQLDINLQRVFYQPSGETLRNDAFHFSVSYKGITSYSETQHQLQFAVAPDSTTLVQPEGQYWVNAGRRKRVAGKFLRPFLKLLNPRRNRDVVFTVVSRPQYGTLLLNEMGNFTADIESFTFDDVVNQLVFYQHNETTGKHCSDTIGFAASEGGAQVEGQLLIAVRRMDSHLGNFQTNPRTLLGQTSFVFDAGDISSHSPFCAEFVTYHVVSPPSEGVLTLYDAQFDTVLQLGINETFTAGDIQKGYVRYSLADPNSITQNISDGFVFKVSDPKSSSDDLRDILRVDGYEPPPYQFNVLIVPTGGNIVNVSIKIYQPQPITWLAEKVYGYRFSTEHIVVQGPVVRPADVVINVMQQPALGTITKNGSRVGLFTLEEVSAGLVSYEFNLRRLHSGVTQDSLVISIVMKSLNVHVLRNQMFSLQWCTVSLQQEYTVDETAGGVEITIE